jgi:glycosyltransferase involved in cell wall biosynthesis
VKPLRVLHVTPYSAEAWAYGGIPRLSGALARGLVRRGHEVTVCATDACDESSRLHPLPDTLTTDGVTLRIFPNVSNHLAYRWQLFLPLGLGEYLKQSAGQFDVAHLHACRNLPGAIAARHLHRAGVPYVLAPNGTAPRIERRQLAKRVFDVAFGAATVRRASRVLAVSEAERAQLRALGVSADRIRLVPNPVDLDEFQPPPARGSFRSRLALGPTPLVLYLGQLLPRKRIDVLVRAFARLTARCAPDARLIIAGNDMGAAAMARRASRDAGVAHRTIFTGLLRGRERLEALADADVVVYPSEAEVFGLVPLESLLCGTPVIVADDSGCAEIVGAVGGGQIVPLGDVAALGRAIDQVLDHPARWRSAAADGAARVRARYAGDSVCGRLDEVYRELVTS